MDTTRLYTQADDARGELAILDRHIAEAKDEVRAAIQRLEQRTRVVDAGGRCFCAALEAIDDMMAEERDEIRDRIESANIEIGQIEWEDLQRSAPVRL